MSKIKTHLMGTIVFFIFFWSHIYYWHWKIQKSQRLQFRMAAVVDGDLSENMKIKLEEHTSFFQKDWKKQMLNKRLHWVTEASSTEASLDVLSWLPFSVPFLKIYILSTYKCFLGWIWQTVWEIGKYWEME